MTGSTAVGASPLVTGRRFDRSSRAAQHGWQLYLDRYWRYEQALVRAILDRGASPGDRAGPPTSDGGSPRDRPAVRRPRTVVPTASGGGRIRHRPPAHGHRRRTRHRQDPHRGAPARRARELAAAGGRPLASRLAAPTGKAAARLTEAVIEQVGQADVSRSAPGCSATEARDPAPPARGTGTGRVPPRRRRPTPGRCGGRRRDVDGVADADGPPARRGPTRGPARAGRRPVPAGRRRGRSGARPTWSRRLARAPGPRVAAPPGSAPLERVTPASPSRSRAARRRRARRCCAAGVDRLGGVAVDRAAPRPIRGAARSSTRVDRPDGPPWPANRPGAGALGAATACCARHRDGPNGVAHWNREVEQRLAAEPASIWPAPGTWAGR